jgi:hypothetical protein
MKMRTRELGCKLLAHRHSCRIVLTHAPIHLRACVGAIGNVIGFATPVSASRRACTPHQEWPDGFVARFSTIAKLKVFILEHRTDVI